MGINKVSIIGTDLDFMSSYSMKKDFDHFYHHIISLPSSTYIYVMRLTLPDNHSIQALRVLATMVADHRLLPGKNL